MISEGSMRSVLFSYAVEMTKVLCAHIFRAKCSTSYQHGFAALAQTLQLVHFFSVFLSILYLGINA